MPAVRLQELRDRAQVLWETWHKGEKPFYRALEFTWQRYGFPGHKPGRSQVPDDLPAYHVPKGVLHVLAQTWHALLPQEVQPRFLEDLWRHRALESRETAVLLWSMQEDLTHQDLERFWNWYAQTRKDPSIRKVLLDLVANRLARAHPDTFAQALFERMDAAPSEQRPGLLSLSLPLLHAPDFDAFPHLRKHLTPWLSPPEKDVLPEWVAVLRALFRRWPGETMPWIRQLAHRHPSPHWSWLLRRLYPWLDEPWKDRVRALAKELEETERDQDTE